MARAQAVSEAVQIKSLAVKKARLAQQEAAARALPHVDLQASGAYLVSPPTGYTVAKGTLGEIPIPGVGLVPMPTQDFSIGAQPYDAISVAATLSQPLFTWGKIRAAIDAAALQAESAGTDLVSQRRDTSREVHRAYFSAVLARESEKVLGDLSQAAAGIVADRQAALDQGTGTREPVLEAKYRKAQVDSQLVQAEQGLSTALESLGMLTGLDPEAIELSTGFREAMPALDEPALRARVLESSTEVAASRNRQGQARKKLDIERGGEIFHPDLSLGLSLAATGAQNYLVLNGAPPNSNASTSWSWDLIISLGMKMSVFDGMESAARVGQAKQDLEAAGQALVLAQKLARLAVRQDVEAALKADAGLSETLAAEGYAAERLANAQSSFDGGMASRADLRGAQILMGSARLDRLLAQFNREEALADLSRLTGDRL
jgi:HAE1 family hydrophobic/amphiphilic exporter-1